MPDETGTEATRSDAPSADESLFGDAADDAVAAVSFDDRDLSGLTQEVSAVIERARAKWEDEPKYPAHERPAPPARRRTRRGQGSAQASAAEGEADQQQPETLRLF